MHSDKISENTAKDGIKPVYFNHDGGKLIQVIDHVDRDAFSQAFEELMRRAVCQISK